MADFFDWGDSKPRSDGLTPYIIRQGDYLRKIATLLDFNETEVWNLPANDDIRKNTPNPWQLWPGDVLFVPSGSRVQEGLKLQSRNLFSASYRKVKVNFRFQRSDGKPRAKAKCTVVASVPHGMKDGREAFSALPSQHWVTNADGLLSIEILVSTRFIEVAFLDDGLRYRCQVGALMPPDTLLGVMQRVSNLGLVPGAAYGEWDPVRSVQEHVVEIARRNSCASREELATLMKKTHGS